MTLKKSTLLEVEVRYLLHLRNCILLTIYCLVHETMSVFVFTISHAPKDVKRNILYKSTFGNEVFSKQKYVVFFMVSFT